MNIWAMAIGVSILISLLGYAFSLFGAIIGLLFGIILYILI